MVNSIEHPKVVAKMQPKVSRPTKLATTIIWGIGNSPLDSKVIHKSIQNVIGIFYQIAIQVENENRVRIEINAEDQLLETRGLMQMTVFNVLTVLCQKLNMCILHVENQFLPEYA